MQKMGFSTQEHRNMLQFIGESSTDVVKDVLAQSPLVDVNVPYSVANLRGFMAWSTTVKLVTSFLKVHTEAAKANFDRSTSVAIHPDAPKSNTFPAYRTTTSKDRVWKFDKEDEKFSKLAGTAIDSTLVVMARPQESEVSGYGPGDAIPENVHNLVFSYFDGMQLPDRYAPVDILQRFFFYTLGSTFEQCCSTMNVLRKGWTSLAGTSHGKAISHLLQGIRLALETGTSIYAVIEARVYQGFILQSNEPFWIGLRGKQVVSVAFAQAKIDLQLASAHTKALSQICKILSESVLKGTEEREIITRASVKTARGLHYEVSRRALDAGNKQEIQKWADYLSFPQEYSKVTPANLVALFSAYSGETTFNNDVPMFLGAGLITSEDKAQIICASFGVTAPSLIIPKGETCKVPIPGIAIDASIVADKDGRAFMPFIAVYMKSVKAAAQDLQKVFKSREVSFKRGVRGGAAKTSYQFVQSNKDDIWKALAASISFKNTLDRLAEDPNKKLNDKGKKRVTEDDQAGPSKKVKAPEDFSAFL
ncbi:TPA_asm: hypothetical protein [Armillaria ectypa ambi-like virus 1]|uniref:Nucleocapsid protein n=1 Tax=Armillaria ectypa ambi-like virus 1 TaxID=2803966 RepID=A0A8D9PD16_9VIRU|nr:TPA_asm: hypothetical protein [Armillaria ectypa ambi-like virus 1]